MWWRAITSRRSPRCLPRIPPSREDFCRLGEDFRPPSADQSHPRLSGSQAVDLSALIQRQSQLDDHPPAPPASTPPVPLLRPPPARPGEPRLAPPARRLQENGDPAETTHH